MTQQVEGHNMGLLIKDPYIYMSSPFLVAGHSKHLAGLCPAVDMPLEGH